MKKSNTPISDEDEQLFKDALEGTKRIVHDKVNLRQQRPAVKVPKKRQIDELEELSFQLEPAPAVTGEQELDFARNGISERECKRLRLGHFTLDDSLDLHGFKAVDAETELLAFILHCIRQQSRYVRIIHGQGYGANREHPVLKNMVNRYLRSHPMVLAFCTCQPNHGGRGAVNVLLKHKPIAPEE